MPTPESEHDECREIADQYTRLRRAVRAFFDLCDSPSPTYQERAVEVLRDCACDLRVI